MVGVIRSNDITNDDGHDEVPSDTGQTPVTP